MRKDESNSVSVDINTIIKDFTVDAPGLNSPAIQTKLTKKNKQDLFLLSIGTFLEYFDLMLYVHMGFLLNELFFPKTDPYIAQLLAASAFCSTYMFRPLGALIFGWVGDNLGRRHTIMFTTFLMAVSCIGIAICPTYEKWGLLASFAMISCRILQGISSMGEIVGAEIYMTEHTKPPVQYFSVTFIGVFTSLGATAALFVGQLITSETFISNVGISWRFIFIVGAIVAFIGTSARRALRETPEFVNAKKVMERHDVEVEVRNKLTKLQKKTLFAFFCMQCSRPLGVFLTYTHCASILKYKFNYTDHAIIKHNMLVSFVDLLCLILLVYLSSRIYPLKIVRARLYLFFLVMIPALYFIPIDSPGQLMLIQALSVWFGIDYVPAAPVCYRHFPLLRRFTSATVVYALSRAAMYCGTALGTVVLVNYFGNGGIFIFIIPIAIGMLFGLKHFEQLDAKYYEH